MQLPAYTNEGVRRVVTTAVLALCGEEHLTTLVTHLPGIGFSSRMSSALQVYTVR